MTYFLSGLRKGRWLALLGILTLFSVPAARADGFFIGSIEYVRVHDVLNGQQWQPPAFWFTLVGASAAAIGCPSWTGDRAILVSQSKESLLLVLSAQMTGKQVSVYYSSTQPLNGYCRAVHITTGDSPPAF